MNLNREISYFWNWAGLSFEDYCQGKTPDFARQPEWEGEYPGWNKIEASVDELIVQIQKDEFSKDDIEGLLQALAIDNESEAIKEKILKQLTNSKHLKDIVDESFKFNSFQGRWQIVDIIMESSIQNKIEYLVLFIENDPSPYVKRRALLAIYDIDPSKAEFYASLNINNEDEYLRLISLRILKKLGKFDGRFSLIMDDPSKLIQDELKK
jgi:hypothetical protein